MSASSLVDQDTQGTQRCGPRSASSQRQARTGQGSGRADCEAEWSLQQGRCSHGHLSKRWASVAGGLARVGTSATHPPDRQDSLRRAGSATTISHAVRQPEMRRVPSRGISNMHLHPVLRLVNHLRAHAQGAPSRLERQASPCGQYISLTPKGGEKGRQESSDLAYFVWERQRNQKELSHEYCTSPGCG
jgi:hypothetical protein